MEWARGRGLMAAGAAAATLAIPATAHSARGTSPAGAAGALPPPAFGRTVDIGLVSGTVVVTPPGGTPFRLGAVDRNVPIGSLIDTDHGRVDLRAALVPGAVRGSGAAVKVEDAQFYDGSFRVSQPKGTSVTDVRLAGGDAAACSGATAAARAALSHRVMRLLRASGPGRFRTVGRYAAATVRGTVWLTEDFCDGTLVQVSRGIVSVEDLVSRRTVIVRAGHSFFSRARPQALRAR